MDHNCREIADKLARDIDPTLSAAMMGFVELIRDKLARYPAASEANAPRAVRGRVVWYERGYGPRWVRKRDGSIGGTKTSETLGRSWSTTPQPLGAILASSASYCGAVHRDPTSSRRPKQARFHAARGWITDREAVSRVLKGQYLQKILGQVVARIVE
jgi:hypothetical protein